MKIFRNISDISKNDDCVLCLGNFDGVHTGHRQLIKKAKELAAKLNCMTGIYTFAVNSKVLLGADKLPLLTTEAEKNQIFSELGVNFVCCDDFVKIKDFSPEEFCSYLAKNTGVKAVVCGENYTFGKFASANSNDLTRIMKQYGIQCAVAESHFVNGTSVSSTEIRNQISKGNMDTAAELLGYRYFIETEVVHGAQLGRKLGFPTINQPVYGNKAVPCFGVYCCICTIDGKKYMGVVNVGTKPTVTDGMENPNVVYETNILDYTGDLYGKTVKLEFYKKLRSEMKFPTLADLKENVLKNIDEAREFFRKGTYLS